MTAEGRKKIIDYLDKQFWHYKQYECMPEKEHGYEYVPRESLEKIVDGLIPMIKRELKLDAAQQSKKLAEHDIESMAKCLHHYINVKEVNQYDTLIFGAMRDYADDFAGRQQSKMPTSEECDKKMFEILSQPTSLGKDLRGVRSPAMMMAEYSEWLRNQIEK